MKELYYLANYRLPTERAHGLQVAKMCEAFIEQGVQIRLVAPLRSRLDVSLRDYYHLRTDIPVQFIKVWDLTGKIQRLGYWIQSIGFALRARRYIRRQGYQGIIFTRDLFVIAALSWMKRNLLVYEIHTMPTRATRFHKWLWQKSDCLIAISGGLADVLVAAGVPRDKIFVAHDGFDSNMFGQISELSDTTDLPWPSMHNRNVVLYLGSLFAWKGVYTLAEAATLLHPDYQVVMVGGPVADFNKIKKYLEQTKNTSVSLVAQVSHRDAVKFMNAAQILVLPNSGHSAISRHYTSPLKLFEYLASHKPIVASDLPSIKEIAGGYSGVWFVAPDNAPALARAIRSIPAGQTYERDVTRFTWRARAQAIMERLDTLKKANNS